MATVTGTLTVNAAFLMEIKEDNRELRQILDQAESVLRLPPEVHLPAKQVVDVLSQLRDQLAIHFSLEEAYGYFEEAIDVNPRLGQTAHSLRTQHVELFNQICDLVEESERLLYGESSPRIAHHISTRYCEFRQQLSEHEAREEELILEALDDDIGVGD